MDHLVRRSSRSFVLAAVVVMFVVGACGGAAETSSGPPSEPTATPEQVITPSDDPGGTVPDILLGSWFSEPRKPATVMAESAAAETPCRAALADAGGDTALAANAPRVIADFRGLGQAWLVFADADHAAGCRAVISADYSVAVTGVEPLGPLGPPPAENAFEYVRYGQYDDVPSGRTAVIGRAGAQATFVIVSFPDNTWTYSSMGGGWYLAWWPGNTVPTGIGMTDARRLTIAGKAPPEGSIP